MIHSFTSRGPIANPLTPEDLTPTEVEFIAKCKGRRELLHSLGDGEKQVEELREMYSWESFLRELRQYVAKNWKFIVSLKGGKSISALKTTGYIGDVMSMQPSLIAPVQEEQQQVPVPTSAINAVTSCVADCAVCSNDSSRDFGGVTSLR